MVLLKLSPVMGCLVKYLLPPLAYSMRFLHLNVSITHSFFFEIFLLC
jgi:hypothetical protein